MVGDSSGLSGCFHSSSSRYDDLDARRFKAERNETRRELEIVSKKAGIAELEWEHQRKQLWRPLTVNPVIHLIST
jgi:hypothetical protein